MSTNGAATEITCLIADDHEVVREGLRLSLSRSPQIRVVGEASDGASAVAIAKAWAGIDDDKDEKAAAGAANG